tara:strand:+ start:12052 stop:12504 length:453 start_codon:yes stop_codon:yes gene_type:complete
MNTFVRTTSANKDFLHLVKYLDADLAIRDGDDHAFHAQYNKSDTIKHVLVAYHNKTAVGCGAFKHYDAQTAEIKRMYVSPECRGQGIATALLTQLEQWARELTYTHAILETGDKYPEAIALYKKNGYTRIPNYGQYIPIKSSRCFKKELT